MQDDMLEERLRRALNAEADTVRVSGDGLQNIRAGIAAERHQAVWWRRPAIAVAAAAVLGLAAGGLAVGLSHDSDDGGVVANRTSEAPTPSTSPTSSTSATTTTTAPTTAKAPGTSAPPPVARTLTVPVYYLADPSNDGPRLYREFHRASAVSGSKGRTAVVEMLRDNAADPDYTSLWPTGTKVLGYSVSGGVATVNLSRAALGPVQAGSQGAEVSLQQLVYTVQAAEGSASLKVRLLIDGRPVTELWGAASVDQPLTRADPMNVRGWVWITAPAQGSTVGSPVSIELNGGYGSEGNVVLKFLRNGTEVKTDSMTTQGDAFVVVSKKFVLEPGSWEVRAYQDSAKDGSLALRDSKSFTVR